MRQTALALAFALLLGPAAPGIQAAGVVRVRLAAAGAVSNAAAAGAARGPRSPVPALRPGLLSTGSARPDLRLGLSGAAAASVAPAPAASASLAPAALPAHRQPRLTEGRLPVQPVAAQGARQRDLMAGQTRHRAAKREEAERSPLARLGVMARAPARAELWTGGRARPGVQSPEAVVSAAPSGRPRGLASFDPEDLPRDAEAYEPLPPRDPEVLIPAETWRSRLRDQVKYKLITLSSLYWYTFPRLIERWGEFKDSLREARTKETAVKGFMSFFVAHRVLGSTGTYAPMGFRPAANRKVVEDAWLIFDRQFHPDAPSRTAFARLIGRAVKFNPNRRSTQFRKLVFHALREGAVKSRAELPAFFDSLATPEEAEVLRRFQDGPQQRVLETFDSLVEETILDINRGLPRGSRVVAALLMGSFANGAAGPNSDLDVQAISEDGGAAYNELFLAQLKLRWKTSGMKHPLGGFQYALSLSKRLITRAHPEPYHIATPYPQVAKALARSREEEHATRLGDTRSLRGTAFLLSYSLVLFAVLIAYEAARRILRKKN